MFRVQRTPAWPPAIDLATVRETLSYMEGDLRRVPGLEAAAAALKAAREEIDAAERRLNAKGIHAVPPKSGFVPLAARFLPRR